MKQTIEKCPHCGASHFTFLYETSTAIYCTPVYKDGKWIQKDLNKHCYSFRCCECGEIFSLDYFPSEE